MTVLFNPHNIKITGSGKDTLVLIDDQILREVVSVNVETDATGTFATIVLHAKVAVDQDVRTFIELGGKRFSLQEVN